MNVNEAYEKYKHLDNLLSDESWLSDDIQGQILIDLWSAIKQSSDKDSQGAE